MKILFILLSACFFTACTDPSTQKTRREKLKETIDSSKTTNENDTSVDMPVMSTYFI